MTFTTLTRRNASLALSLAVTVVLVPACGDSAGGADDVPPLPWPASAFPELPDIAKNVPEARVKLGNFLFYDPVLSVDHETACVTCHSEFWGMSDALPRAVGNGAGPLAGPGREGPNTLRRNSPTLFNLAFRESLLWDGQTRTLEEQATMPLIAEDELNVDPQTAADDLAAIPAYVELFSEAFPDDPRVTVDNMTSALAAFQRTFVSDRSIYDAYVDGDADALTDSLVEGMFRFAEMGCNDCHAPPLFESETFANRNIAAVEGVIDDGRAEVTGRAEDRGKFRTPSLRNVTNSKPYFHNGSTKNLEDAVRHELAQGGMPYTDEDAELITRFIDKALRDDSRQAERPNAVPSGLPMPLDGVVFPGR